MHEGTSLTGFAEVKRGISIARVSPEGGASGDAR